MELTLFVASQKWEKRVSIDGYRVIGDATIGPETQIGSHMLIRRSRYHPSCDASGNLSETKHAQITIGNKCRIGDGSILTADIWESSTIVAGAVVTKPIPSGVVVVANPARPLNLGVQLESENHRVGHPK